MKKFLLLSVAALASTTTAFAAGGSRLEKVTGTDEYGATQVVTYEYDTQGRLSKIVEPYDETITFDYTRLAEGIVKVVETEPHGSYSYEAELNEQGYVAVFKEDEAGGGDTWTLTYDADGRLVNVTIKDLYDAGPEVYDITYTAGSITSWKYTDKREVGYYKESNAVVTNTEYDNVAPLYNIEGLLDIDIDQLEYMSAAGYLGVAPAKLPASVEITESDGEKEREVFTWTVDANNYPVKLKVEDTYDNELEVSNLEFVWSVDTAIDSVTADTNSEIEAVYGLDGVKRNELAPGLNIVRHADGTISKVIVNP